MSATAFERVTFRGLAVVPRRRVPLAPLDPAQARRLFLRHALAENLWNDDSPFVRHNADVLARAKAVQTKLRRRNVVKDPDAIAQWFAERVPSSVTDAASFRAWYATASPASPRLLHLSEAEVLNAEAAAASEPSFFPDAISPGDGNPCALAYAWEPGKEEDGLTIKLPLLRLPDARAEALAWVVPGMLAEKTHALLKALPRSDRENLERKSPLQQTAADAASLLTWRESTLPEALAEVLRILHSVDVPAEAFDEKAVPDHLRLRVLVVDEHGKELAAGRNLAALRTQLAGRLTRAQAGAAKKLFERSGITTWDFDPLPAESKADGQATSYPSLIDAGDSIRVSLLPTPRAAQIHTWFGVRRALRSRRTRRARRPHRVHAGLAGGRAPVQATRHHRGTPRRADLPRVRIGVHARSGTGDLARRVRSPPNSPTGAASARPPSTSAASSSAHSKHATRSRAASRAERRGSGP
jgi:ATP-dependent helicase HrpA